MVQYGTYECLKTLPYPFSKVICYGTMQAGLEQVISLLNDIYRPIGDSLPCILFFNYNVIDINTLISGKEMYQINTTTT